MFHSWYCREQQRGHKSRSSANRSRRCRMETLEPRLALATFFVAPLADALGIGTLRQAVLQANATAGADTIVLRPGTFALSLAGAGEDAANAGDLDIVGKLTIRGAGQWATVLDASALGDRALDLLGGDLTLEDMTIRGGRAEQGGGVRVQDGNLTIVSCRFLENTAAGVAGSTGQGGGVYQDGGVLVVQRSEFRGNRALGGEKGGNAEGGAVCLVDATANFSASSFLRNQALGATSDTGPVDQGGTASGGAVVALHTTVTVSGSVFRQNLSRGGDGADGVEEANDAGEGFGGALALTAGASLTLGHSILQDNVAQGGKGGNGPAHGTGNVGRGGAIFIAFDSTASIDASVLMRNAAIGGAGGEGGFRAPPETEHFGGNAQGGAVCAFIGSRVSVTNSSLLSNRAVGGAGGDGEFGGNGGSGAGGALWATSMTDLHGTVLVDRTVVSNNEAQGGAGGRGESGAGHPGGALGGAISLGTSIRTTVSRSQVLQNRAVGPSGSIGGGIQSLTGELAIRDSIFASNEALGGTASYGSGGALHAKETALTVSGTTFARNLACGGNGIDGYDGGWGQGGAITLQAMNSTIQTSVFAYNRALGGTGGASSAGGGAEGGAIDVVDGHLYLSRSRLDLNEAIGGAPGGGDQGEAIGGAINADPAEALQMNACTVRWNKARGSTARGGGVFLADQGTGAAEIKSSTILHNSATTEGDDIFGPFTT